MTNSGEVAGIVPAVICWAEVPVFAGLYSPAAGV